MWGKSFKKKKKKKKTRNFAFISRGWRRELGGGGRGGSNFISRSGWTISEDFEKKRMIGSPLPEQRINVSTFRSTPHAGRTIEHWTNSTNPDVTSMSHRGACFRASSSRGCIFVWICAKLLRVSLVNLLIYVRVCFSLFYNILTFFLLHVIYSWWCENNHRQVLRKILVPMTTEDFGHISLCRHGV